MNITRDFMAAEGKLLQSIHTFLESADGISISDMELLANIVSAFNRREDSNCGLHEIALKCAAIAAAGFYERGREDEAEALAHELAFLLPRRTAEDIKFIADLLRAIWLNESKTTARAVAEVFLRPAAPTVPTPASSKRVVATKVAKRRAA